MSTFVHILMTRFNVPLLGLPLPGPDWLTHRFQLFEHFCLPSVRAQSCRNFRWLVFFNPGLDDAFRARIESYRSVEQLIPVYIEGALDPKAASRAVAGIVAGFDYAITSRFDNDDAIATRYVETVQSCFDGQAFQFLNFPDGYQLGSRGVYRFRDGSNPFISLVERTEGLRTVFGCGNHTYLAKVGPIRQLNAIPGWLQVVHGRNALNRIRGTPAPHEELAPHFSIYPQCMDYFA